MAKINVISHQTPFDIAIQTTGSAEGVFELEELNDISMTDLLSSNQELNKPTVVINEDIYRFYKEQEIKPATGEIPSLIDCILNKQAFSAGFNCAFN